jgi:hypothetical protein
VKSNSDLFGGVFSQNCYLKNYKENLLQTPCCKKNRKIFKEKACGEQIAPFQHSF